MQPMTLPQCSRHLEPCAYYLHPKYRPIVCTHEKLELTLEKVLMLKSNSFDQDELSYYEQKMGESQGGIHTIGRC